MDYLGFGYVVDSCPENLTAQTASASRLKCGVDKFGNSQYLCVPNFKKTAIVEYCYNDIVGLHKKGSCLVVNDDGIVDIVSCGSFTEGCTTDFFKSSDLYQYPACHQIDTEARCFSADPACHQIDPEITRNISFVTSNTTSSEFSTTLNYTDSSKNIEYSQISPQAITGITFGLLFVFIGILFIGYLYLRLRKKKRKQKETVASEREPFDLEENVRLGEIERNDEEKFRIQPEHNRVGISGNAKKNRTDEHRDKINESNKEEPLIPKESDVGLREVEETNTGEKIFVGDYSVWKTCISDEFSTLTDDEVFVLFCFLSSDSGPPDFTDTEWLDMLNKIRQRVYFKKRLYRKERVYRKEDPVTSEEAQQTLNRLKSRDFLWEDQDKIKEDIKDGIMYQIASEDHDIPFYYSSYDTARMYLRSWGYSRKPEEKCVISHGYHDTVLIHRLQMNILTHVTMEDTDIYDKIYHILNVPKAISQGNHSERENFLSDQKQEGEAVHYRGRSQDSVHHVTWIWREGRPDIVRSCIGPHPHWDIYIIDNKAYSKQNKYHKYPSDVKCLLCCLLLVDEYTVNINENSHKTTLNKIRDRYFKEDVMPNEISKVNVPEGIVQRKDNKIIFTSDDIRHDVMYAFVTECLVKDSDLKFFLTTASGEVISEYCRSWGYERSEGERCLYMPYEPKMLDSLIDRLQLDIITHCPISDKKIRDRIIRRLGVPPEVLRWDRDGRKQYVEYAKRGTQTDHHSWGVVVGCLGAGKNRLLKCFLRCNQEEIQNVESTEGLEVHEEINQMSDETKAFKGNYYKYDSDVRCLLYCLLLVDEYTIDTNEDSYKTVINKISDRYFEKDAMCIDISKVNVPEGIIRREDNMIKFTSDDIRHDVMYTFVTDCLVKDSNLEFFLATASGNVITEYCRSWTYDRGEEERCLYVPEQPDMFDPVIDRLQLDIIAHYSISDENIRDKIIKRLGVPKEILRWDRAARKRYVEYAKRGTQTVHHARGMIVGCAGAGKTTLLKRLLGYREEEIRNVKSTEGLEVHEEIFQICDDTKTLKALTKKKKDKEGEILNWSQNIKTLSFFDFGGQCAYYACHQIYLTRRAFYVVVVDASKPLDQMVDKAVCDQDGSVFSGWTYGEYFVFWIKSIHTYCRAENEGDQKPVVLIVATHWEHRIKQYKDKDALMEHLQRLLPRRSHLPQYITRDNCYCLQFSVPLDELESHIASIACHSRWEENIPIEWVNFGIYLLKMKLEKIINTSSIEINATANEKMQDDKTLRKQDMLRFYHDAGKILHFNDAGLEELVIVDVQWFVDAFKNIITDKLHLKGIAGTLDDWDEYYENGNLKDELLKNIWDDSKNTGAVYHKETVLRFMQRLGLVAIGKETHYVPCMNRKEMDSEIQNMIIESKSRSSVLVYRFDILPFFFFFRLVVACMQETGWDVIKSNEISYLYKNAALFAFEQYNIILSVTADSIQLQVLHVESGQPLDEEKTHQIQDTVERLLTSIIGMFHKKLMFAKGIRCQVDKEKPFAMEIQGYFLEDKKIQLEDKRNQVCPLHRMKDLHFIDATELKKYWKF